MKIPSNTSSPVSVEAQPSAAHTESDFAKRWQAAGATPEELDELRASLTHPHPSPLDWVDASTGRYSKRAFQDLRLRAELQTARRRQRRLVLILSPALLAAAFMLGRRTNPPSTARHDPRTASVASVAPVAPIAPIASVVEPAAPGATSTVELTSIGGQRIRAILSGGATLTQNSNGEIAISKGTAAVSVARPQHAATTALPQRPLRFVIGDRTFITASAVFAVSSDSASLRVYSGEGALVSPNTTPVDATPAAGFLILGDAVRPTDNATMTTLAQRLLPEPTEVTPPNRSPAPSRSAEIDAYVQALSLLRHGDWRAASDAFERYRQTYPEGVLLEEAELSRIEALAHSGDQRTLIPAATQWLEKHPNHPRSVEIRALLEPQSR